MGGMRFGLILLLSRHHIVAVSSQGRRSVHGSSRLGSSDDATAL
jgi:hypothetical protein